MQRPQAAYDPSFWIFQARLRLGFQARVVQYKLKAPMQNETLIDPLCHQALSDNDRSLEQSAALSPAGYSQYEKALLVSALFLQKTECHQSKAHPMSGICA